jgi:hypothetical protein
MGCNPAPMTTEGMTMNQYLSGYEVEELDVEEITLEGGVEAQREVLRDAAQALREILEG